jgi:hypothetical protein
MPPSIMPPPCAKAAPLANRGTAAKSMAGKVFMSYPEVRNEDALTSCRRPCGSEHCLLTRGRRSVVHRTDGDGCDE